MLNVLYYYLLISLALTLCYLAMVWLIPYFRGRWSRKNPIDRRLRQEVERMRAPVNAPADRGGSSTNGMAEQRPE